MFSTEAEEINPNILGRDFPVLVTGGAGYMASWLVKYLLEDGYKVRITVRDLDDGDKYRHLEKIAEASHGSLEVFAADLLDSSAFNHCMNGCNLVFHTASPYKIHNIRNPQKELIDPSFEGTRNVLEAVNKCHSVKKVVFTSGISAIYGDATDAVDIKGEAFNEDYWNKTSNLKYQSLGFAKTVAEREAWRIHDEQQRWKMAVLNPALFLGPSLTTKSHSGSFDFLRRIVDGTLKNGVPNVQYGLVDVRDVAHAHIFAAQDEYATGRFMLVSETKTMLEIAALVQENFPDQFALPNKFVSPRVLYFLGFVMGYPRRFVVNNVDRELNFDNTKSRHELGVYYKSVDEAILELLKFILENNMLK